MIEQKEYDFLEKITSMDDKVKSFEGLNTKSSTRLMELLIFIGVGDKEKYRDYSSDLRYNLEQDIIVFLKYEILKEIRKEFGKGDDMLPISDEFYDFLSESNFYDVLFDRFIVSIPVFFAELLKGNKKLNDNFSLYFKYILNDILATYTLLSTNSRLGGMTSDETNLVYNVLQVLSEIFKKKLYKSGLTDNDEDDFTSGGDSLFSRTMSSIDSYYSPIQVSTDDLGVLYEQQSEILDEL